jgi:hypothetical protein
MISTILFILAGVSAVGGHFTAAGLLIVVGVVMSEWEG